MRKEAYLLFQANRDPDRYVYHYTSAKTALAHILPGRTLRLGSYQDTNDPKEKKQWKFGVGGLQDDAPYIDLNALSRSVSDAIKLRAHILCTSMDGPEVKKLDPLNIYAKGYALPRMWAQYALRHTGVCLILERASIGHLIRAQLSHGDLFESAVSYSNRSLGHSLASDDPYIINAKHLRDVGIAKYAFDHIFTHHKALFFEKSLDWRDEREYRWLFSSPLQGPLFIDISSALVGLVFGQECTEDNIKTALTLTRNLNLSFEKMEWNNSTPWLSFRLDWPS